MIKLEISGKIVTVALVPMIPTIEAVEMAEANGDQDAAAISVAPALQIYDKDGNIETSLVMSKTDLRNLSYMFVAVGAGAGDAAVAISKEFNDRRNEQRQRKKE